MKILELMKMKKLLMTLVFLPLMAVAREEIKRSVVDGIAWTYTIFDSTDVRVGAYDNGIITAIPTTTAGAITVPAALGGNRVTGIGDHAFFNLVGLGSVSIPSSVTGWIGSWAFCGCSGLTSVTIPNGMTGIDVFAFKDCISLKSVTIPNSVKSVGYEAFRGCSSLRAATIPSCVARISTVFPECDSLSAIVIQNGATCVCDRMFYGCSGLTSVTIPRSVTSIGPDAFYGCRGLKSVVIPSGVATIEHNTFDGCSGLTSVSIPESVTSIGYQAFQDCSGLKSVTIPRQVTSIGYEAFDGCSSLVSAKIPASVTSIGNFAFGDCSSLERIYVDPREAIRLETLLRESHLGVAGKVILDANGGEASEAVWIQIRETTIGKLPTATRWGYELKGWFTSAVGGEPVTEDTLISGDATFYAHWQKLEFVFDGATLVRYQGGGGDVVIPDGTEVIGDEAFCDCQDLATVSIPESVTSIGDRAFAGCSGLTSVTLTAGVRHIGAGAFDGTPFGASQPEGLVVLGSVLYECKGVSSDSVTIPDGVVNIGTYAFSDRDELVAITIPDSVLCISQGAFEGCDNLKTIYCSYERGDSVRTMFGDSGFVLDAVSIIESPMAEGGPYTQVVEGVTWVYEITEKRAKVIMAEPTTGDLKIPPRLGNCPVTSIGDEAFSGCEILSVAIPVGVTRIGCGAFMRCRGLKSLLFPDGVLDIGDFAFQECNNLMSVAIPLSVSKIGVHAFAGCGALKMIVVGKGDGNRISQLLRKSMSNVPTATVVESALNSGVVPGEDVFFVTGFLNCAVTGLPTGLTYDKTTGMIKGMAKRPGEYNVKFTKKEVETAEMTIFVKELPTVATGIVGEAEGCKVTGAGAYLFGKRVTLKATAKKGYVFAGWYRDEAGEKPVEGETDYRAPSYAYVVGEDDVTFYAKFIPVAEDWVGVWCRPQDEYVRGGEIAPLAVEVGSASLATVKVTGLPTGLKFTAKLMMLKATNNRAAVDLPANTIYGTPTKSGIYTATITATTAGKKSETYKVDFVVRGDGEYLVDVMGIDGADYPTNGSDMQHAIQWGKMSGYGVFKPDKTATLKATANKGYVFAGWFSEVACVCAGGAEDDGCVYTPAAGTVDYRSTSFPVKVGYEDVLYYARFVRVEDDKKLQANVENAYYLNGPWSLKLDVESMSLPTVMVKGLPSGLKFDAKTLTILGTPTKPGSYPVTLTLKNKTITKAKTQEFTLYVANIESPYLDGVNYANDAYVYRVGTSMGFDIGSCARDGYSVTGVSGLPSGLKFDKNSGLITGVPTKAGPKTVTITLKNGKLTSSATITLNVDAIDTWAYGTFNGGGEDGVLTLTVGNTGKISGKWMTVDGTWTLSAKSYESYDEDDRGRYRSLVGAKCGTETTKFWLDAHDGQVDIYEYLPTLCGYGSLVAVAKRNVWKESPWKDLAIQMRGVSFALTGEVSLKIGASGAVTASGKFVTGQNANGKDVVYSASCSTVLVPVAEDAFKLYLCFPKKNGKFDGEAIQTELEWDGSALSIGCGCREGF